MYARPLRPLAVAAAAAVWAVFVPAAHADHGDIAKATRLANAVEFRAQAAAQLGAAVGRPDYLAFANLAGQIAAEAHTVEVKLAVGDVPAAKLCVRRLEGLVKALDEQEDRLSKCGYRGRDARDAADDAADELEDAFDDLEDEVEDLRFVPVAPIVVRDDQPHPPILGPPVNVRPGYGQPNSGRSDFGRSDFGRPTILPPRGNVNIAPPAPGFGSNPARGGVPHGFEYQGEGDGRGVYYGPSRGLGDPTAPLGRPSRDLNGFDRGFNGGGFDNRGFDNGSFDGGVRYDPPFDSRNSFDSRFDSRVPPSDGYQSVPTRDSFRPVPGRNVPSGFDGGRFDGGPFDGPALPALPPQAHYQRPGRTPFSLTVSLVR